MESQKVTQKPSCIPVKNSGIPIKLSDANLHGVSAEAGQGGEKIQIWTRLSLTSDAPFFHTIAENLDKAIRAIAQKEGKHAYLGHANSVLLVMRPDNSAKLWINSAALELKVRVKRSMAAGSLVFENDIADITAMDFPCVDINPSDRVIYLFREGWRFGLFFDFNPESNLCLERMGRDLGTLYRKLKYRHLYDLLADTESFKRVVDNGWFPFVEILGYEFREIANVCDAGFSLVKTESKLLASFDDSRLENMFARWMSKEHFAGKELLLRPAVNAFKANDPVPVLKIVLSEIEGILAEAYVRANGKRAKIKELLAFAVETAERKTGMPDTLFFPAAFAHYLENYTFAYFDPSKGPSNAGSRHAVGHGAAETNSYTKTRALQALLTLDQLAFYT